MSAPVATRVAYGEALPEMGELFPNLLVLDSDISRAMHTGAFEERFPERHFDFGIAEQDMMAAAAGMAAMGKIPVVNTYAVFAALRGASRCARSSHIRTSTSKSPSVTAAWRRRGGATHQGLEDMSPWQRREQVTIGSTATAVSTKEAASPGSSRTMARSSRLGMKPPPGRALCARRPSARWGRRMLWTRCHNCGVWVMVLSRR